MWVEPFFIDRTEISVGEYNKFLSAAKADPVAGKDLAKLRPITHNDPLFSDEALPVTGVSFFAAEAYARRRGKRLPTMLEWLRAARGQQDNDPYPCGDLAAAKKANLHGTQDGYAVLAPAAATGCDASAAGVHGLTGNVREWTSTWASRPGRAGASADASPEPADGTMKIVKGGSWRTGPENASPNTSEKHKPNEAFDDLGFRCVVPFFAPLTNE